MLGSHVQRVGLMSLLVALFLSPLAVAGAPPPHIGYGFNVANPGSPRVAAIGFDWIKTFNGASTST